MDIKDTLSEKAASLHQRLITPTANQALRVPGGEQVLNPAKLMAEKFPVAPGAWVADLGTGSMAYFALQAAKQVGPQGRVYAVDVVKHVLQSAISQAKLSGLNNVLPIWSDLETYGATKIPGASLDAITMVNILFQSKNPGEVLREANRLLKLGGRLLVIDWLAGAIPFAPPHRISAEEVKKLGQAVGLVLAEQFTPGKYHWGLIFKKS